MVLYHQDAHLLHRGTVVPPEHVSIGIIMVQQMVHVHQKTVQKQLQR